MDKKFLSSLVVFGLGSSFAFGEVETVQAPTLVIAKTEITQEQETPEEQTPSPEEIARELTQAQKDFQRAKKMFNPWYTGPIITPPGSIITPGLFNVQPYVYNTRNYAKYDKHGHSHDITRVSEINYLSVFYIGMLPFMDMVIVPQGFHNHIKDQRSNFWGDTAFALEFGLLKEGISTPAMLIQFKETFPTGRYKDLNPKKLGTDATGAGSYQTTISLNTSKVVWWWYDHPMSWRLSLQWDIPSSAKIRNFNAYGGGLGTNGRMHLGESLTVDLGYEISLTQPWVFALDVAYIVQASGHFSGHRGIDPDTGLPFVIEQPFNEQLSLAPALEYNVNENLGIVVGPWFSVWGRNSDNFISGVFSFEYTF